ncbi:MAG: hypothetical protein JW940_30885 [Polyangiaceae bacterium]|nr:hypothetical protein [Polyangiaceae bacterium]
MAASDSLWLGAAAALVAISTAPVAVAQAPDPSSPPRVEITLVGAVGDDPALEDRIRSLFDPAAQVELHHQPRLVSSAVLDPADSDKVYLWISLKPQRRARVYATMRDEQGRATRYLFREVELDSGLDEVGAETLAEIAHSSSMALWWRGQQISRRRVMEELARDVEPPAVPPAPDPPGMPRAATTSTPAAAVDTAAGPELAVGATFAAQASGDEGWLAGPGGFFSLEHRWSLRLVAFYVVPHHFDAGPARVSLVGASTEARAGYVLGADARSGPRVHFEVGVGALAATWQAEAEPPATPLPGETNVRGYALGSLGAQLPVGPIWVGTRLETRWPLRRTSYDVVRSGEPVPVASSGLSGGVAVEIGIPITRSVRSSTP